MSNLTNFQMVREFHRAFNVTESPVPNCDIGSTLQELRLRLIEEETDELVVALDSFDNAEILKELCDLLYVVYGFGAVMGMDVDAAFALVHASNMSKLTADGTPLRRSDGKIMKSVLYTPPDLSGLL